MTSAGLLLDEPVVPAGAIGSRSGAQVLAEIVALDVVARRVEARRLALVAEAHRRGLSEQAAGVGMVSWLVAATGCSRRSASVSVRLGAELRDRLPLVAAELAAGGCGVEQVRLAAAAIRDLPRTATADRPDVDRERGEADELLAGFAVRFGADDFARVARQLAAVIASQGGERTRRDQRAGRRVSLAQLLDGSWRLDGLLDAEAGALVAAALDALARPLGPQDQRPAWARRADALAELAAHHLDTGAAGERGGVRPHVQVTIDAETLLALTGGWDGQDGTTGHVGSTGAGAGGPVTGAPAPSGAHRASSGDVERALALLRTGTGLGEILGAGPVPRSVWERLLCDSVIRRVVLDPDSMPLDVGRAARSATPAQRAALLARDHGCAHPGCRRPAAWTDAHHIHWYRHGGRTDLRNMVLLCRHHHTQVHDGDLLLTVHGTHLVFTTRHGRELGRHQLSAEP